MTTLCLDFGNTRLKAAVFENDQLKEIVLLQQPVEDLKHLIEKFKPAHSILSSVINHPPEIDNILNEKTKFHKLSNASKLPLTIPVGKPETMGADRLAIAVAAVFLFPKKNNLAIGLGSCITYPEFP